MSNEEKSLFDEVWAAAGLSEQSAQPKEEPKVEPMVENATEEPTVEEPAEELAVEKPAEEPTVEEPTEEPAVEELAEEPAVEVPAVDHAEKKKSVKFLVIYTVVFVIVITALIGGSYIITSRIQQQSNEDPGPSQSTLQNIKDKNEALQKENNALKEQNENLTISQQDAEDLLDNAADMVEHNEYLSAAMAEYIDGNRADARAILSTIDRKKLSPTAKEYYDLLDDKLN